MFIADESELIGLKSIGNIVAFVLKEMQHFSKPGISTKELDDFGTNILKRCGANSAPHLTYQFPGSTCISINNEFCHGIPSVNKILKVGDLINIDVSAEKNGFYSDNGASFVLGEDINGHQKLINASKEILRKAIYSIKNEIRISDIGYLIESEANLRGFKVVKNLTGHGIGRKLHEEPSAIANYQDNTNITRFKNNTVVAIETFISTNSNYAITLNDGWTMIGDKGGYMAQHEHTIIVTNDKPIILTEKNEIWN